MERLSLQALEKALSNLEGGFPEADESFKQLDAASLETVLTEVAERMKNNYPYPHPLYAGQMLKPPHPVAKAAYMMSLWINPNNHALDGGRASSAMEKEVVADLAKMFGFQAHLGHLTGGGTMANMEALWVAGQIHPDKKVVASDQSHYTHARISHVLKQPYESIPTDRHGRMDLDALENVLKKGQVGTVVATMATTGVGSVDSLHDLLALQKTYQFRIHADAAYGGYFRLLTNLAPSIQRDYAALDQVDSLVIDPHKQGLQPYGCGCVLFQDPSVAKYYLHDSPYTYFTSDELHLGEISLECSRPGAAAVALWATHRYLPLEVGGRFASDLSKGRETALAWANRLREDESSILLMDPIDTDIVVWALRGKSIGEMSKLAQEKYEACEEKGLYFSLFKWPTSKWSGNEENDSDELVCLRACFMKPEHLDWLDRMWAIYANS